MMKNGQITERFSYRFRAEFFNALNHPSFNGIDTGVLDSNFGQVNSAITPRNIQFGLRVLS